MAYKKNEKIFSVCGAMGRTVAEFSYELYWYKEQGSTPQPGSEEAKEFQKDIDIIQKRYKSLVIYQLVCWVRWRRPEKW